MTQILSFESKQSIHQENLLNNIATYISILIFKVNLECIFTPKKLEIKKPWIKP